MRMLHPVALTAMVGSLLTMTAPSALAANWYVAPLSTDCRPASPGAGTLANPWTNLFYALTTQAFNPDDVILLRGGTYQNTYNGFSAGCNAEGATPGINTVLPLALAGTSGHPITIQNFPGEEVIVDGSNARRAIWTSCGASGWTTSDWNVGSAKTAQIWVNPSGSTDPGTRLKWTSKACSSLNAGEFSNPAGTTINVRLAGDANPNSATIKMSCQNGDCAYYALSAVASNDAFVVVQKNATGGSVTVKYGYHCGFFDGAANNVILNGVNFVACGGHDYGNGVRVYNANNVTIKNGLISDTMAEGAALYGGGPGCSHGQWVWIPNPRQHSHGFRSQEHRLGLLRRWGTQLESRDGRDRQELQQLHSLVQ